MSSKSENRIGLEGILNEFYRVSGSVAEGKAAELRRESGRRWTARVMKPRFWPARRNRTVATTRS